ncbi:hypothetical protein CHS0354_023361 [Potamilus streckersoni]|uniref:Uncharacterized protein n=1 Tax=Potamilus streckersoni TaxID=2493646 RepID=A0AAE0W6C3_9BIVA|nr:hypothetical protein CHS0354_023361 [Potamilus streckersoni]
MDLLNEAKITFEQKKIINDILAEIAAVFVWHNKTNSPRCFKFYKRCHIRSRKPGGKRYRKQNSSSTPAEWSDVREAKNSVLANAGLYSPKLCQALMAR